MPLTDSNGRFFGVLVYGKKGRHPLLGPALAYLMVKRRTQHSRASRHLSDHVVACLHQRASPEMTSLLSSSQQFEMLQDPPRTVAAAKHRFTGKEVWKYFEGFSQRFRGVVRDVAGTLVNAEGIEVGLPLRFCTCHS